MKNKTSIRSVMLINSKEEAEVLYSKLSKMDCQFNMTITDQYDQFVSTVATELIECFILDWNYAHFNMIDLIARIRKIDQYKKTPIICIADKNNEAEPMRLCSLHVDMVITRPFNLMDFDQDFNKSFGELMNQEFNPIPESTNVLIMDDSPEILEIMVDYMKEIKHAKFKTCKSITEAKNLVNASDFDLFLLDWNLGDGTCIDLINFVRSKKQSKRLSQALIMVVTSRDDIEDTMTLLRHNVKDHLIKPFEYSEFEEKVTYAIERHSRNLKAI